MIVEIPVISTERYIHGKRFTDDQGKHNLWTTRVMRVHRTTLILVHELYIVDGGTGGELMAIKYLEGEAMCLLNPPIFVERVVECGSVFTHAEKKIINPEMYKHYCIGE